MIRVNARHMGFAIALPAAPLHRVAPHPAFDDTTANPILYSKESGDPSTFA